MQCSWLNCITFEFSSDSKYWSLQVLFFSVNIFIKKKWRGIWRNREQNHLYLNYIFTQKTENISWRHSHVVWNCMPISTKNQTSTNLSKWKLSRSSSDLRTHNIVYGFITFLFILDNIQEFSFKQMAGCLWAWPCPFDGKNKYRHTFSSSQQNYLNITIDIANNRSQTRTI